MFIGGKDSFDEFVEQMKKKLNDFTDYQHLVKVISKEKYAELQSIILEKKDNIKGIAY